jgi:hypothetical protein
VLPRSLVPFAESGEVMDEPGMHLEDLRLVEIID